MRVVFDETVPIVAVIVELPVPELSAAPFASTIATPTSEDVQLTWFVSVSVLPSLKFPTALNCWLVPRAIEGFAGVRVMDDSVAPVTVT